jgi:NAD(P)-dependent dehydrogenase (short-subunit alcohol dehydrogenase family)
MLDNTNQSVAKTAIVSGGARGIGRCIVRRFLERGYKVFIFDIDEEELKHTTTVHLKQYHDKKQLSSAICNLRSVDEIRERVKEAADFLGGRIEVVVNNGGIAAPMWKEGKAMDDLETFPQWQA